MPSTRTHTASGPGRLSAAQCAGLSALFAAPGGRLSFGDVLAAMQGHGTTASTDVTKAARRLRTRGFVRVVVSATSDLQITTSGKAAFLMHCLPPVEASRG